MTKDSTLQTTTHLFEGDPAFLELLEVLLGVRADLHDGPGGHEGLDCFPVLAVLSQAALESRVLCNNNNNNNSNNNDNDDRNEAREWRIEPSQQGAAGERVGLRLLVAPSLGVLSQLRLPRPEPRLTFLGPATCCAIAAAVAPSWLIL